jgi:CO/xanthine dehydrogenase Mo-binding subunit
MKVKLAEKGGRLTGLKAELAFEAGAFPGSPVGSAAAMMIAPYNIQDFQVDAYDVVVNKPKTAAYRAPGAPIGAFAMEQCIDELARKVGTDPLKFRLQSSSREGVRAPAGTIWPRIGHEECLQAALSSPHYRSPIEGPNRGRGVASGAWGNAGMQSSVNIAVNADGSVNLIEGSTDIGGSRASLAMQLAETLGLPYEAIKPTVVDTDSVGFNDVTGGSRTTHASGIAVVRGGQEIIKQLEARGAKMLGVTGDAVEYRDGRVCCKTDDRALSVKEIGEQAMSTGGPITASASVNALGVGAAFATHVVDVEVDPETGKVQILRYTAVQDVGTAIHPSYVEGQIQGGAVQGIGWALNEEYYYNDDGALANGSFLDYRMPTALDLPMIDTILVEVFNPGHPFGVRGVGEVPIVPPLAAIANAVYDAVGTRFTDLPLSARRIVETLA